jgi:hypothetical protein
MEVLIVKPDNNTLAIEGVHTIIEKEDGILEIFSINHDGTSEIGQFHKDWLYLMAKPEE